jgi:hypothetical protein
VTNGTGGLAGINLATLTPRTLVLVDGSLVASDASLNVDTNTIPPAC